MGDGGDEVVITKYLVELWGFRATDLTAMKPDGTSDVYVRANFDHYKILRTNTAKKTLCPKWKCCFDFLYETRFAKKLYVKSLQLEVMHRNPIKSDELIGRCSVDLQTIANGSYNYELVIRKNGRRSGRLQFCCSMTETGKCHAGFSSGKVTTVDEGDYSIKYYFNLDRDHSKKTPIVENTNLLEFAKLRAAKFEGSVRSIFTENFVVVLRRGKPRTEELDKHYGVVRICFIDYMDEIRTGQPFHVSTDFLSPKNGRVVGHFEGDMTVKGCPQTAQLMGTSKCTDEGIRGGYKMFAWLADPPRWQEPELRGDGKAKYLEFDRESSVVYYGIDDDDDEEEDYKGAPTTGGLGGLYSVSTRNLIRREEEERAAAATATTTTSTTGTTSTTQATEAPAPAYSEAPAEPYAAQPTAPVAAEPFVAQPTAPAEAQPTDAPAVAPAL